MLNTQHVRGCRRSCRRRELLGWANHNDHAGLQCKRSLDGGAPDHKADQRAVIQRPELCFAAWLQPGNVGLE